MCLMTQLSNGFISFQILFFILQKKETIIFSLAQLLGLNTLLQAYMYNQH